MATGAEGWDHPTPLTRVRGLFHAGCSLLFTPEVPNMVVGFPNGSCCLDLELGMTPPDWAVSTFDSGMMWCAVCPATSSMGRQAR